MKLIGNGQLITRDSQHSFIQEGCILVKDQFIGEIGTTKELKEKYPQVPFIDAHGGLIMPGFINTHHHIYSALARGITLHHHNPSDFQEILEGMWWKLDEKLTLEDIRYSAYGTYIDCIKNGVTTVFDHHASYGAIEGSLFEISDVAKTLGLRTSLCFEVSDRHGEEKMKEAVRESIDFILHCKKESLDMQKAMMGLHASFTLSDNTLDYISKKIPAHTGYHIHVAEGIQDVHHCLNNHHKRIVHRLMDKEILGSKTLAVHCIHVDPSEMDLLKATDTMVVHNPESNMGNAVGCTPILSLMERDITLGLGTDGYTSDMLESMKVANILHKHHLCNPSVAWAEVPKMLFSNNATIANRFFDHPLGILEKGAYADVIVAEYCPPTPLDSHNINNHLLFGLGGRNVTMTMINGRILMQDRQLKDIDEESIMAKSRALATALWKKMNG